MAISFGGGGGGRYDMDWELVMRVAICLEICYFFGGRGYNRHLTIHQGISLN